MFHNVYILVIYVVPCRHIQKAQIVNQESLAIALEKAYRKVKEQAKELTDLDEEIKVTMSFDSI